MATRRQTITAAAYLAGNGRTRPTHKELAGRMGVCRSAVTRRLKRFADSLSDEQRERYLQCLRSRGGRKRRVRQIQLSMIENV